MGQYESKQNKDQANFQQSITKPNYDKIQFIEEKHSDIFGKIDIFRMTEKPYQYIMRYTHKSTALLQLHQLKKYYSSFSNHPGVVPIQALYLENKKQMCSQFHQLQVYSRYYNFTLSDAINRKKHFKTFRFGEADIIYALKSLLEIGIFYHNVKKQGFRQFSTENIFLTPQGHIKVYLMKKKIADKMISEQSMQFRHQRMQTGGPNQYALQSYLYNQQQTFQSAISSKSNKGKQFKSLMGNAKHKIDPFQDIFDIGITVLCLVQLKSKKCYVNSMGFPKTYAIRQDIMTNWPFQFYSGFLQSILSLVLLNEGDKCSKTGNQNAISQRQIINKIVQLQSQESFEKSFYMNLTQDSEIMEHPKEYKMTDLLDSIQVHKRLKVQKINPVSSK